MALARGLLGLLTLYWLSSCCVSQTPPDSCTKVPVESLVKELRESLYNALRTNATLCTDYMNVIDKAYIMSQSCEQAQVEALGDWDSFEELMNYINVLKIEDHATAYTLMCLTQTDGSVKDFSAVVESEEKIEGFCDLDALEDVMEKFDKLEYAWDDPKSCPAATNGLILFEDYLEHCKWRVRSVLGLFHGQAESYKLKVCAPSGCNFEYSQMCLHQGNMALDKGADVESKCRTFKYALACHTLHTRSCRYDKFAAIDTSFEGLRSAYKNMNCSELPPSPTICTVNASDTTGGLQFDVNKLSMALNGTSHSITDNVCKLFKAEDDGSLASLSCSSPVCPSAQSVRDECGLDNNCKNYGCIESKLGRFCSLNEYLARMAQLQLMGFCNILGGSLTGIKQQSVVTFMRCLGDMPALDLCSGGLPANTGYYGCFQAAAVQEKAETARSFYFTMASTLCNSTCTNDTLQQPLADEIMWYLAGNASCNSDNLLTAQSRSCLSANDSQILDSVVNVTMPTICDSCPKVLDCFKPLTGSLDVDGAALDRLEKCTESPEVEFCEGYTDLKQLTADLKNAAVTVSDVKPPPEECFCDPAGAMNCILDIQLMSREAIPDWPAICGKLDGATNCSYEAIKGCSESKKGMVMEIVKDLNEDLTDVCKKPEPPSPKECNGIKATACVKELALLYKGFEKDPEVVCPAIFKAEECVETNVMGCEPDVAFGVKSYLKWVSGQWQGLVCEDEVLLKTCLEEFEDLSTDVLKVDVQAMLGQQARGEDKPWSMDDFKADCGKVNESWNCIQNKLEAIDDSFSKNILDAFLSTLYDSVKHQCTTGTAPPTGKLSCHVCQNGVCVPETGMFTSQCSTNTQICQKTTKELDDGSIVVTDLGCIERASCTSECKGPTCTYCCGENKNCNTPSSRSVEGACDILAYGKCTFELTEEYINTEEIQCSSVDKALACIESNRKKCFEFGQSTVTTKFSMVEDKVKNDTHECKLAEADQSCDDSPILSAYNQIYSSGNLLSNKELCRLVNKTRTFQNEAMKTCSNDEVEKIKERVEALELMVGSLSCETSDVTSGCQPVAAFLSCFPDDWTFPNRTCEFLQNIEDCVRGNISKCETAPQISFLTQRLSVVVGNLAEGQACNVTVFVDEEELEDLRVIYDCLDMFAMDLMENATEHFYESVENLYECMSNMSGDYVMKQKPGDKSSVKRTIDACQYLLDSKDDFDLSGTKGLEVECKDDLDFVVANHASLALTLPFLSVYERKEACRMFEDGIDNMTAVCGEDNISQQMDLLDLMRKKLILPFCPDIRPCPRCAISVATECLLEFEAFFDIESRTLCPELFTFGECAQTYTSTCRNGSEALKAFQERSQLTLNFAEQACAGSNRDLVISLKCLLTSELNVTTSCEISMFACDIRRATVDCYGPDLIGAKPSEVQGCLNGYFHCFTSTMPLVRSNLTLFWPFLNISAGFNPQWPMITVPEVKDLLQLPDNVPRIITQDKTNSLNLWDICLKMDDIREIMSMLVMKHGDRGLPALKRSAHLLAAVIDSQCNTADLATSNLTLHDQEPLSCPVLEIKNQVDVLFSQLTVEFYTYEDSATLCQLYHEVTGVNMQTRMKYGGCSSGFQRQVTFVQTILKLLISPECGAPDDEFFRTKRCDVGQVQMCTAWVYMDILALGKRTIVEDICNTMDKVDKCVASFSYRCDSYNAHLAKWLHRQAQKQAALYCDRHAEPAQCFSPDHSKPDQCEEDKAKHCSLGSLKTLSDPFLDEDTVCNNLAYNADCMRHYSKNCTELPTLALYGKNETRDIQKKLGCSDKDYQQGCQSMCKTERSAECFEEFDEKISFEYFGIISAGVCRQISNLIACVDMALMHCTESQKRPVMESLDAVLEGYPGHENLCRDVTDCAKNFEKLVREIKDVDDGQSSSPVQDPSSPPPRSSKSLFVMCELAKKEYDCIQNGLVNFDEQKRSVLGQMYEGLWKVVQEDCSDTSSLTCLSCQNEDKLTDCKDKQTCNPDKQACFVERMVHNVTGVLSYNAGCRNPKSCDALSDGYCCYESDCNNQALAPNPIPGVAPCQYGKSLTCALDFSLDYLRSKDIDCSKAEEQLNCVDANVPTCGSSLQSTSLDVFLQLAVSSCIVNAKNADCSTQSFMIWSTLLTSAYATQDDGVCRGISSIRTSVDAVIKAGKCTGSGKTSLNQVLEYAQAIAGTQCETALCETESVYLKALAPAICKGSLFEAVKAIDQAQDALEEVPVNCGEVALYRKDVDRLLENCEQPAIIKEFIRDLDGKTNSSCSSMQALEIPDACPGLCSSAEMIEYTDSVKAILTPVNETNTDSCWHLRQVEKAYEELTLGCPSVQQVDVSTEVIKTLEVTITACEEVLDDFSFDLKIKHDVYYPVLECEAQFQENLEIAYETAVVADLCTTVQEWYSCDYQLPKQFENFLVQDTKELADFINDSDPCVNVTDQPVSRRKRDATCDAQFRKDIINDLNEIPVISTTSAEVRERLCRSADKTLEEANKAIILCKAQIPAIFVSTMQKSVDINTDKNKDICIESLYEEDSCDPTKGAKCVTDFSIVSHYADLDEEVICRQAKSSLECLHRYHTDCTGANKVTADKVKQQSMDTVKGIVANRCPYLTNYLYCDGKVDDNQPACKLDEGVACNNFINDVYPTPSIDNYCEVLTANISCVENALTGCSDKQIDSTSDLANTVTIGAGHVCGTPFDIDSICKSAPPCPSEELHKCYDRIRWNDCRMLSQAMSCEQQFFSKHKQCNSDLNTWFARKALSVEFEDFFDTCGVEYTYDVPALYNGSSVEVLMDDMYMWVSCPNGSADDAIFNLLDGFKKSRPSTFEELAVTLLYSTVEDITLPAGTSLPNQTQDSCDFFEDTDSCSYSLAISCLSKYMMQVLSYKLLTHEEREDVCRTYLQKDIQTCIDDSLDLCEDKGRFDDFVEIADGWVKELGQCTKPGLCVVSEGFQCTEDFGHAINQYEMDGNVQKVCKAKYDGDACLRTFVGQCKSGEDDSVRTIFQTLYDVIKTDCEGIPPPPTPLCPNIPELSRVCNYGKSFQCLANFNLRLLASGDSLLMRQQCISLQHMMVCVATNSTSCDPKDPDTKTIMTALDEISRGAEYRCPWLTDDKCSLADPCPVESAGCETDLELGLIQKLTSPCKLLDQAYDCVAEHTKTCNAAQKLQATEVIESKLTLVGLPKDLDCTAGSMDETLFNYVNSARYDQCDDVNKTYTAFSSIYSNPNISMKVSLGKELADALQVALCADDKASPDCPTDYIYAVWPTTDLIFQLILNNQFENASFCAQSIQALTDLRKEPCMSPVVGVLESSELYTSQCVQAVDCSQADSQLQSCVDAINSTLVGCHYLAEVSACIIDTHPVKCGSPSPAMNNAICSNFFAVKTTDLSPIRYTSETGLNADFPFSIAVNPIDFDVEVSITPVDDENVPRCLKGSAVNEPIPQLQYYKALSAGVLTVSLVAVQDYRLDGVQEVDVEFTIVPLINDTEEAIRDSSYSFQRRVMIDDRDQKMSTCSSINDPHITTFDQVPYNNMFEGEHILYENTKYPAAVSAKFESCAIYGTCNCEVGIYSGNSSARIQACGATQDVVYNPDNADGEAKYEPLRFFRDPENTNHIQVVIVATGTMVIVKFDENKEYLNVWIMPSGLDYGLTRGLCGLYDGQAHNDFVQTDNTPFVFQQKDRNYALEPKGYSSQWIMSPTSFSSLKDIELNLTNLCKDNSNEECDPILSVASCGFAGSKDWTAGLVEMSKQTSPVASRRRRRRSVEAPAQPTNKTAPGFPTKSGISEAEAEAYCAEHLNDEALDACRTALSAASVTQRVPNLLQFCVQDILASDNLTAWTSATIDASRELCRISLNKDPAIQKNSTASDLSMEFLNQLCSPHNCNGHGKCNKGVCVCDSKYYGSSCSIHESHLKTPPTLDVLEEEASICATGPGTDCSAVYMFGSGFIRSPRLTCHIRSIKITESGQILRGQSVETIVKAELFLPSVVRCSLGEPTVYRKTVEVSVSNDGVNKSPVYQPFLAYEPSCLTCEGISCSQRNDICVIGNKCLMSGETSIYDDCKYCNLDTPYQWSWNNGRSECRERGGADTTEDDDESTDVMYITVISIGCVLVVLVTVLLAALCVLMKRRQQRRQRDSRPPPYSASQPGNGPVPPAYPAYSAGPEHPHIMLEKMPPGSHNA